ncbi:phage portal protein [Clostridium butyricum]|uniref:Phage portal protein, HK97 family n=1 Tax=Clostridium butyricum E4 str. BoNT E BL5262 TaxID=632245 RepID=C4IH02_CLOBU|nr:phage portal protein [Clostridium butyricum]EEP53117.1 phage portal protein, HK97 family [Clostridium butyricum E4 str. BoNT E BL5262]NFL30565.1 phage portal protein [Clostridium butyricum]NFS19520.1 phage portal protein [Clostridium butyricum]
MAWFKKKEKRKLDSADYLSDLFSLYDVLLKSMVSDDKVNKDIALNIPTLAACVDLIGDTISALPIKLLCEKDGKVEEIKEDHRVKLLNDDTGDTLDAYQFKKALIDDFLLMGNGYAYINKVKGKIKSIHYVEERNVSINKNIDPIFKNYDISVNGEFYRPYEFIKLLRNSKDGATGEGIIESNPTLISVSYNSLLYENILAKTGGNKKGFIKADDTLDDKGIKLLKQQWNTMYSQNSENCIVLNKGLDFKESSSTSTEMQMNENKVSNGNEICKILKVPSAMLTGEGKENNDVYEKFVKMAILPILQVFITALNRDLLLEHEKESFYFAFDVKELLKGDIEKRYKAYEIGIKNGFLTVNDVRYEEDKEAIEAFNDVIKLGLQDVLFNTKTGSIYTPNTDKTSNLKGGDINEDRTKE